MVAAAPAPARPVPTTMTVNRRLLAGFTSFISNLCFSHFCSIGPSGIFASRTIEGEGAGSVGRGGAGGAGAMVLVDTRAPVRVVDPGGWWALADDAGEDGEWDRDVPAG